MGSLWLKLSRLLDGRHDVNVGKAAVLGSPVPVFFTRGNKDHITWAARNLFFFSGHNPFALDDNQYLLSTVAVGLVSRSSIKFTPK